MNVHSPQTRGWQSPRFCEYPQQLGLALVNPARLTQVQLLSHQSKIATKIEIFVGEGQTYSDATWKRLGYLSLDDNSRSDYQARELKSVYIDCTGSFVKLLVHKCYLNKHNIFNQVGIVAINILGEYIASGIPGNGGGHPGSSMIRAGRNEEVVPFDLSLDPDSAARIRHIVAAKERAVEMEDYDAAKRLKAAEAELCGMGVKLTQLESAKRSAVSSEDYDRAKALKVQIDSLRNNIRTSLSAAEQGLEHDMSFDNRYPHAPGAYDNRNIQPHDGRPVGGGGGPHGGGFNGSPYAGGGEDYGGGGYDPNMDQQGAPYQNPPYDDSEYPQNYESPPPRHSNPGGGSHSAHSHSQHDEEGTLMDHGDGAASHEQGDDDGQMHPLVGVPNYEELPVPEPLAIGALGGEGNELTEVVRFVGEYVVRCLLSKQWSLREAALLKFKLELSSLEANNNPAELVPAACKLIQVGCEDKIAQVFLTTLQLLDVCLPLIARSGIPARDIQHRLENVASTLVFKLGDNQSRVREAALDALLSLAACSSVGCDFVVRCVTRKLATRQTGKVWRPLASRLQLLRDLVDEYGIGPVLSVEAAMAFIKDNEATSHTSQEVFTIDIPV